MKSCNVARGCFLTQFLRLELQIHSCIVSRLCISTRLLPLQREFILPIYHTLSAGAQCFDFATLLIHRLLTRVWEVVLPVRIIYIPRVRHDAPACTHFWVEVFNIRDHG